MNFFRRKWVIEVIGIVAVSGLIWFVGPLVAIGGNVPLETESSRWLLILTVIVLWALNILRRYLVARRNNQKMIEDLSALESSETLVSDASEDEIEILNKDFKEALGILKESRSKGLQGLQYLYELPWYIIIGPPGSGKTTALVNSGLHFPLADRFENKSVRGVGGTRNCDWWFTEEAVFLDTAGRYTTQDSHQAVDQAAWLGFLDLLKRHRPRRPLNGVLVTMSVADLLQQTEEERILHARAINQRIQELNKELGIRVPVYMLFTKCDLVAGFNDFFTNLSREERGQVWGETFPVGDSDQPVDCVELFMEHYEELVARLDQRLMKRMQDERDMRRRSLVFGFPQQMFLLRRPIHGFLAEAFGSSRYRSSSLLRGVYFTSGTQEGTPIDRVMGILADSFNLDRQSVPVYSGQGRSYFITKLLLKVVFQESGLTGIDQRVERKKAWIHRGAIGLGIAVIGGVVSLWSVSFGQNRSAVNDEHAAALKYSDVVAADPEPGSNLMAILPRLNAAYDAVNVFAEDASWSMGFGLYQGDKLRPSAQSGYERVLTRFYLPSIIADLEDRIRITSSGNPDVLYQLLRVYLMFGEPARMEPEFGQPWISLDWGQRYKSETDAQNQLVTHLGNLLALKLEPINLDPSLVLKTRRILNQIPVAEQVFARLKSEAFADTRLDISAMQAMGPSANRVFRSLDGDLHQLVIPGLFTLDGYHQVFLKNSLNLVKEQVQQDWVLGDEKPATPQEIGKLQSDMQRLYFQSYINYWDGFLAKIAIRNVSSINQLLEVLEYATGPDSPIKTLLLSVKKNTILAKLPGGSAVAAVGKAGQDKADGLGSRMERLLDIARGDDKTTQMVVEKPGEIVEQHFKQLNLQVQGEALPIDHVLGTLSDLYAYLSGIVSTSGGQAVLSSAAKSVSSDGTAVMDSGAVIGRLRLESKRMPDPLQRWLNACSTKSSSMVMGEAEAALNKIWVADVYPAYQAGLENRYPLFKTAKDAVALDDFARFFGPNGVMEKFFNTHLKPFVDTSSSTWRIRKINQQSIGVSASVLRQFQYAEKIREVFFRGGGVQPSVQFELKPVYLDANVAKFTVDLNGQIDNYRHGPMVSKRFQWPGSTGTGRVRLVAESLNGQMSSQIEEGTWAWFRILDHAGFSGTSSRDRFQVTFKVEGSSARYELYAPSVDNPFKLPELENFRCPASL